MQFKGAENIQGFARRAEDIYRRDRGRIEQMEVVRQVVRNTHSVEIPPSVAPRARQYKTGIGREKTDRSISILVDGRGPLLTIYADSTTRQAQTDAERVQEWCMGGIHEAAKRADRNIYSVTAEDVLNESVGFWRVLADPKRYNGEPDDELPDDVDSNDESARRKHERTVRRLREQHRRRNFPIDIQWVPAESVRWRSDAYGLAEVYEYQAVSVQEVLDLYLDEDGEPLAEKLNEAMTERNGSIANGETLTYESVVTVCIRMDREHYQIAVLPFEIEEDRVPGDYQYEAVDVEMLVDEAHGLDEVPYAYFPGRQTTSNKPEHRFNGFINPGVAEQIISLDYLMTQLLTVARSVAWSIFILERAADGPQSGDAPPQIEFIEGNVWTGLPPGAKITNLTQTNPSDMRVLADAVTSLRQQIDLSTLSAASYGTNSADSGYLQNQLIAAAESTLEAAAWGLATGYEAVARLMIKTAHHIIKTEDNIGAIPVRYTSEDGSKYVSIDERLSSYDWVIGCEIRQKPPGGEAALTSMLAQQKQQGWISDTYAMQCLNIRNPERMRRQILDDRVTFSQELMQLVVQMSVEKARVAFSQGLQAKQPDRPVIPEALAKNLQTEEALARMPGPAGGIGSPPTNAGMPNMPDIGALANKPPGVPGPGVSPGSTYGQAQGLPGGLQRTDVGTQRPF